LLLCYLTTVLIADII